MIESLMVVGRVPRILSAQTPFAERHQLGEGPNWDPVSRVLIHVDISAGSVHRVGPGGETHPPITLDPPVSFALPSKDGSLVTGQGQTITAIDDGEQGNVLASVDEPSENRFNDARCDAAGRLWAGTMSTPRRPTAGLYRLDPDGSFTRQVSGTRISNGIGWGPDNDQMFFVDSPTQRIDAFDYDLDSGEISSRRPFVNIDPTDGMPDGLAVDREGGVWVSLFGGGAVHRYGPNGELDAICRLPTSNPTCPAFGGPLLGTLYLTTARHKLTEEQLASEPLAGALFVIAGPGHRGLSQSAFG
jgi:sugar lactone lactonase YvrE